jgi:hypothetical protein
LLALAEMGASLPYEIASCTSADEEDDVALAIKRQFLEKNQHQLYEWARKLWQAYRKNKAPIPVRKQAAWLAAMEYLYGKMAKAKLSQTELAKKYDVSLSTLAKCIRALSALI